MGTLRAVQGRTLIAVTAMVGAGALFGLSAGAFARAGGGPWVCLFRLAGRGQGLDLCLGEQRAIGVGGRAHLVPDRPARVLRELVLDVSDLVYLAPGDDWLVEDVHYGHAQGAAAIK